MTNWIRRGLRGRTAWRWTALVGCLLVLSGCGSGFFNPSSTGTGSGGGGTGGTPPPTGSSLDSIYVVNSNPNLLTTAGFSLSSTGTLTGLNVSPASTGTLSNTIAINPLGNLVWVGSLLGTISVYVVNSNGTLSIGNGGQAVAQSTPVSSMAVDPTGNFLLVLSSTGTNTPQSVYVYQINPSNGTLTPLSENGVQYVTTDTGNAGQIAFAPNGTQVYVTLGSGGVDALAFSPSNGGLSKLNVHLNPMPGAGADQGLAFDPQGMFLFVTETGINAVRVFAINSDSTLNEVAGSPYTTGLGAKAVVVDKTGAYVYVANSTVNNISAFTLSSTGTLSPLANSPYATGDGPLALAVDNTDGYLVAICGAGNPDLQVFSIAGATGTTPGALTSTATASTGSQNPAVASALAVTP